MVYLPVLARFCEETRTGVNAVVFCFFSSISVGMLNGCCTGVYFVVVVVVFFKFSYFLHQIQIKITFLEAGSHQGLRGLN